MSWSVRLLGLVIFMTAGSIQAEITTSGLVDLIVKRTPSSDYSNETFYRFSNFHTARARLFFDAQLSDQTSAFVQLLIDNGDLQLYAAYARLTRPLGLPLSAHIGLIPTPVGTFAARTYSNANPLIGVPLLYNYHSIFNPAQGGDGSYSSTSAQTTVEDLLRDRDDRSRAFMPIIYDNCWNTGLELFGATGKLDYSIGLIAGSVGYPTIEQRKDVPQVTSRLAWNFSPGLVAGINGFAGPYLWNGGLGMALPAGKQFDDFLNYGTGYDLYIASGMLEIFSELFHTTWQHPTLPTLSILSGYGEIKYTVAPGWFLAGRGDFFEPLKERLADGSETHWDYPVRRVEIGIAHKLERTVIVKLVHQTNHIIGNSTLDHDLTALQLSFAF